MWRSVAGLLDIYRGEKISLAPDLEGFLFSGFFCRGWGWGRLLGNFDFGCEKKELDSRCL